MKEAPIPENEDERLRALRDYEILDTEAEQAFDDLVKIASHICDTPIALISLVDQDRQWFKAKVGIDAEQTDRKLAFCAHAILQENVFEVPNALKDERFADNPLVQEQPDIRFYAGAPLTTSDGMPLGTLCVIDQKPRKLTPEQIEIMECLSRQVISQMELRISNKKLEEASQAKSTFLANMSHEIRTPMNAIIGYSQCMLDGLDGDINEAQRESLGKVYRAGDNLLSLINGLLDISKIEAGQMEVYLEMVDISAIALACTDMIKPLLKDKPVSLSIHTPPQPIETQADKTKVQQILLNLLSNAVKFTAEGCIELSIKTNLETRNIMVAISDTGIGMTEDQLEHVFKPFTQADSSTTKHYGGTGLGLAISSTFADMHSGSLTATSQPDKGSTFVLTLPLKKESLPEPESIKPKPGPKGPRQKSVYVLDDDPSVTSVIEKMLLKQGYYVRTSNDSRTALDDLRADKPDVLLLDLLMPYKDGLSIIKEIKEDEGLADIHVVVVSLHENHTLAFNLGAAASLSKPVRSNELTNLIGDLTNHNPGHGINLAIVDDDAEARELLKKCLSDTHVQVAEFNSAERAQSGLADFDPDILILDLSLPGISGFEFLNWLRNDERFSKLPVIIVSERLLNEEEWKKLKENIHGLLDKTDINSEALIGLINETIF